MIDIEKKRLRRKVKALKAAFSMAEMADKSNGILARIESDPAFISANVVLVYWSLKDEVQTHNFINRWYLKKQILLPVINGENLLLRPYKGPEKMKEDRFYRILEPTTADFNDLSRIDYVLVPGVAFDNENNRMGRGKAFYDKLLVSIDAKKVGLCFDFQVFEKIPTNVYDIKMDKVVYG